MPANVTAPAGAPGADPSTPPAPPHVLVVEAAHRDLGLSYDEIAGAVGANASTLHRWRAGETAPSPAYGRRLAALAELTAAVRGLLGRAGAPAATTAVAARAWLARAGPGVPGLGGERRGAVLAAGQLERLAALLAAGATPERPPRGDARPAGRRS